jgi:hypothetical protein
MAAVAWRSPLAAAVAWRSPLPRRWGGRPAWRALASSGPGVSAPPPAPQAPAPPAAQAQSTGLASRLLGWFTGRRSTERPAPASVPVSGTPAAEAAADEAMPDRDLLFSEYVRIKTDSKLGIGQAASALMVCGAARGQAHTRIHRSHSRRGTRARWGPRRRAGVGRCQRRW